MDFASPNFDTVLNQALNQGISTRPARVSTSSSEDRLTKAAKDFEALFLSEMMKPMYANLDTSGPFGGGFAEKITRSLLYQELAKSVTSSNRGLGLSDDVRKVLLQAQEGRPE